MTNGIETGSKVKRIAEETRALVDDVKTWVDLRIQLTQLEVEGRINDATAKVIVAVVGSVAILFALVGLAILISQLTGQPSLGFFVVAGILLFATLVVWMAKPSVIRIDSKESENR